LSQVSIYCGADNVKILDTGFSAINPKFQSFPRRDYPSEGGAGIKQD